MPLFELVFEIKCRRFGNDYFVFYVQSSLTKYSLIKQKENSTSCRSSYSECFLFLGGTVEDYCVLLLFFYGLFLIARKTKD